MAHPDFVRQTLANAGPRWNVDKAALKTRPKIFITCPSHKNGLERTPSFLVNITRDRAHEPGDATCMACKYRLKWPDLFKQLTGEDLVGHDSDDYAFDLLNPAAIAAADDGEEGAPIPLDYEKMEPWPRTEGWRGIDPDLLSVTGARLMLWTFKDGSQVQQLFLPAFVNGKLRGGVRCNLVKSGRNNYFNTPGTWSLTHGIFPYDYATQMIRVRGFRCVVLVEGPRDALNCIQHGIPAVCLLGASAWSDGKADLVLGMGASTVITAFDPDEAGGMVTAEVYAGLRHEIEVARFQFPATLPPAVAEAVGEDKIDPGNMHKVPAILRRFQGVVNRFKGAA